MHFQQEAGKKTEDEGLSLSSGRMSLIAQVKRILQLILIMTATNATSERSISALTMSKKVPQEDNAAGTT